MFILLSILIAVELPASVLFADFCHAGPTTVIDAMASKVLKGQAIQVVNFYTSCTGINPLELQLNKTMHQLAQVQDALDGLHGTPECQLTDGSPLSLLDGYSSTALTAINYLSENQKCAVINNVFSDIVQNALCNLTINGLWQLWAVHIASGALLYVCMFFTSHVKQKCKVLVLMDEEGAVKAIPLGPPLAPHTI